jgi:GTP-binding protein YchF
MKAQNKSDQKASLTILSALDKIAAALEDSKAARSVNLSDEERFSVYDCHFISMKPQLYVCNVDEDGIILAESGKDNAYITAVKQRAQSEGSEAVCICGKFEAELASLENVERQAFLDDLGLKETGLTSLSRASYKLLGLRTFFTVGADECRAWTIHAGDTAPKAAGVIHTDFEKGFIKAEVYSYADIVRYGTEAKIKEAGRYRIEGRDYVVQDGDVIFFRFNV